MAGSLPPPWRATPPELCVSDAVSPLSAISSPTFATPRALRVHLARFSSREKAFVLRVLNDPRGWAAYGFLFASAAADADADVTVRLTSAAEMEAWYPQTHLRGLSVTDCTRDKPRIFLHSHNWSYPPAASSYPQDAAGVQAYRTYVVLHEMGHALGLGHAVCPGPGALAPVLVQQSKGCGACVRDPWVVKNPAPLPASMLKKSPNVGRNLRRRSPGRSPRRSPRRSKTRPSQGAISEKSVIRE